MLNVAAILFGLLAGHFLSSDWVHYIAPVGTLFLAVLKMFINPILFLSVFLSFLRAASDKRIFGSLRYLIAVYLLFLTASWLLAFATSWLGPVAKLPEALLDPMQVQQSSSEFGFSNLIPRSLFEGIISGFSLQVFVLAAGLGLGAAKLDSSKALLVGDLSDAIFQLFMNVLRIILRALPIGLFCLSAKLSSAANVSLVAALITLLLQTLAASIVFVALCIVAMKIFSKATIDASYKSAMSPLAVAFGTAMSVSTLPAAVAALTTTFKVERKAAEILYPLGIALNPVGNVLSMTLTVFFLQRALGLEFSLTDYFVAYGTSLMAGLAASGMPGIMAATIISVAVAPLGIPVVPAILVRSFLAPIVDATLTAVNVSGNLASIVIMGHTVLRDKDVSL